MATHRSTVTAARAPSPSTLCRRPSAPASCPGSAAFAGRVRLETAAAQLPAQLAGAGGTLASLVALSDRDTARRVWRGRSPTSSSASARTLVAWGPKTLSRPRRTRRSWPTASRSLCSHRSSRTGTRRARDARAPGLAQRRRGRRIPRGDPRERDLLGGAGGQRRVPRCAGGAGRRALSGGVSAPRVAAPTAGAAWVRPRRRRRSPTRRARARCAGL